MQFLNFWYAMLNVNPIVLNRITVGAHLNSLQDTKNYLVIFTSVCRRACLNDFLINNALIERSNFINASVAF